jgi:hypothetical protein
VLSAAFRCDAPARCGAFDDERRRVAGDEGGRVRTRNARLSGSALRAIPCQQAAPACPPPACGRSSRACVSRSRRSLRAFRCGTWAVRFARLELERIARSSHRRAHRHLPVAARPRVGRRRRKERNMKVGARLNTKAGVRTDSASSHRPAHRHLPAATRRRVAALDERRIVADERSGRVYIILRRPGCVIDERARPR